MVNTYLVEVRTYSCHPGAVCIYYVAVELRISELQSMESFNIQVINKYVEIMQLRCVERSTTDAQDYIKISVAVMKRLGKS